MRKSVKKKNDFSDAELLSFALKDVKPFPGRSIKADIKHNTNSMSLMSEKLNKDLVNSQFKKIDGAKHLCTIEYSSNVNMMIKEFLRI